jgi:hypothetical protein
MGKIYRGRPTAVKNRKELLDDQTAALEVAKAMVTFLDGFEPASKSDASTE